MKKFILVVLLALTTSSSTGLSATAKTSQATALAKTAIVRYVNVGQGDGVVIKVGGKIIVSDAGDSSAGGALKNALRALGAKRINVLILSHPHSDHVGSAGELILSYPVDRVVAAHSDHWGTTQTNRALMATIKQRHVPIMWVHTGQKLLVGGARLLILNPPVGTYVADDDVINDSIAYLLQLRSASFLFTGDDEIESLDQIAAHWHYGRVSAYLVTHHGSHNNSDPNLLTKIRPKTSVISVGNNGYGHPTHEAVARLVQMRMPIYCTQVNGDVSGTVKGAKVTWRTTKQVVPWWRVGAKKPQGQCGEYR